METNSERVNKAQEHIDTLLAGKSHSETLRRLGQYQLSLDDELKKPLARWLILVKVRAQQRLLNDELALRADLRYPLTAATKTLTGIIGQLREDAQDITLASLRGYEGEAAAAYFGGYAHLFAGAVFGIYGGD